MQIPNWLKTTASFLLLGFIFVAWGIHTYSTPRVSGSYAHPLTIGDASLQVAFAVTGEEQERGLSGTENLAPGTGMLFVFPAETTPSFWMKDMRYPIDMIWIDASRQVVDSTENALPESYPDTTFSPRVPVRYVLEVPAGFFAEQGIMIGDTVSF
jgi:uncharacterized membrane protein (UPF0127 family)